MTSKISYVKFIREDIRHRGWLAALTSIAMFLVMPVCVTLYIHNCLSRDETMRPYWIEDVQNALPAMVSGNRITYVAYVIVVIGVLAALTGYGYIHSRERSDFYHALPVKREQWFTISYLSGLLIFVIPYVICTALTAAAACVYQIMTPEVLAEMARAAGGGILAFLVVYNTSILAAMLTGQTVTAILASLVIAVYPAMVFSLVPLLKATFFATYAPIGAEFSERLIAYASPLGSFAELISAPDKTGFSLAQLACTFLLIAVLLTGAALLYRIYPAEASGSALSFPVTAPVFKVLICIPTALFAGTLVNRVSGGMGSIGVLLLCFLAVLLLCAIVEFIYHRDLKMLFRGWRSSLICIVSVLGIIGILRFDLLGYDTYIPAENKLEGVSIQPDSFTGNFNYPIELGDDYEEARRYGVFTENTEPILRLVEEGLENLADGITPLNMYSASMDPEDYVDATFCYKLKGGKTVTRRYCIEQENLLSAVEELCKDGGYRQKLFPIFAVEEESLSYISLTDSYASGMSEGLELHGEEQAALLKAYKKDMMETDIRTLENPPVASMWLLVKGDYGQDGTWVAYDKVITADVATATSEHEIAMGSFPVYAEFENTLACLEKYGFTLRKELKPEEVSSVVMYLSEEFSESGRADELVSKLSDEAEYTEYTDMDDELIVRSPEDIRVVAEYIKAAGNGLVGHRTSSAYAEVQFIDDYNTYSFVVE